MSLKYEPASVPQHISVRWLVLNWVVCGRAFASNLMTYGMVKAKKRAAPVAPEGV